MPALTISSCDHTTGQLTITAHGLNTGDGPAGLLDVGGILPATLSPASDFWIIRRDANTISLADSNAHAMAGTAVSFSDNGSGTMSLLIGLPYRVPRIAAKLTQVFSDDFNASWNSTVQLHGPKVMLLDGLLEKTIAELAATTFGGPRDPEFPGKGTLDVPTFFAYALNPGGAFLRAGSANNKIQIAPGVLMQKIASTNLLTPTLLPYTFWGVEEFTLANGDATNPRVDLLQMALIYDSTRGVVSCALTVKQGTPAASPTIPDPDTGCVPVGTAVVGHGWTTGGNAPIFGLDTTEANNVVIHDQRMPLGVRVYRVDPTAYKLETAWALANTNQVVTASNGSNKFFAPCTTHLGRVIAVDLRTDTAIAAGAVTIGAGRTAFGGAPSSVYLKGNTWSAGFSAGTNTKRALWFNLDGAHNPAAGPTIQPSAVNALGVPTWTSGYRTPTVPAGQEPGWAELAVINQTNATSLGETSWYIAGGL
jgi:hypothetical protein